MEKLCTIDGEELVFGDNNMIGFLHMLTGTVHAYDADGGHAEAWMESAVKEVISASEGCVNWMSLELFATSLHPNAPRPHPRHVCARGHSTSGFSMMCEQCTIEDRRHRDDIDLGGIGGLTWVG